MDKCDVCGKSPVPALGHNWYEEAGSWKRVEGTQQHSRTCHRCNFEEKEDCSGGTATCTKQAVCEKCGEPYGSTDPNAHILVPHSAQAPTCTEIGWDAYDTCSRCDYTTYRELPALDHDYVHHDAKAPTCIEIGWDAYDTCSRCDYTSYEELRALNHDYVHHDAKAPTCTEIGWDAYDTCSRCDYTTYQEIPASGHHYIATTTKPTCTKGGYTTHVCTLCKDTYMDQQTPAISHLFGEWAPEADAVHTAKCRRSGCGYTKSVACTSLACQLIASDQPLEAFSLCPVCGKVSDGTRLMLTEHASAAATRLPRGEVLVRMGRIADGNQLMVVGFESAGQLTQAQCPVKISLPAELLDGCVLYLVAADGTETELPFTVANGRASFSLDFTNAQSPAQLIHVLAAQ